MKIRVNEKLYNLGLDNIEDKEFVQFIKDDLNKMFSGKESISVKELLQAYISKNYEMYEAIQSLRTMNKQWN
jgi:flagellar motor component MotA